MEKLIDKVFFYGDYLADQTASGKEESGIRLQHNIDDKLTKEETEEEREANFDENYLEIIGKS